MTKYVLPALLIVLIIVAIVRKVSVYNCFVVGAREGLKLALSVFPYLASILILMELFATSGMAKYIEKAVEPLFALLGIPSELASLVILRPLSGNGSIAVLEDIIARYGVDSYIARTASVIVGASETIFYVTIMYFSTTNVKKLRYTIPVALFASLVGVVVASLVTKVL